MRGKAAVLIWRIRELKKGGRAALKRNYWRCLLVSLIVVALAGSSSFTLRDAQGTLSSIDYRGTSNAQIVDDVVRNIFSENIEFWDAFGALNTNTNGILGTLFSNATKAGSFLFGALNAFNELFFHGALSAGIVLAAGAALLFFHWIFVKLILRVGELRFYLENRAYPESRLIRLFFVYRHKRTRHVAWVMFCRWFFTALWFLTIVGGVIKIYSYRMIPYLMAENPDLSRKDAFLLSRRMMRGNKWRAFLLDLSFLGWYLLNVVTFGLLGLVWLTPYKVATDCELYICLRAAARDALPGAKNAFDDTALVPDLGRTPEGRSSTPAAAGASAAVATLPGGEYPEDAFPIPERDSRRWLGAHYHRKYTSTDLLLLFFAFCFIGYVYEVVYSLIGTGHFINRGTMYGPWLPIYGVGGVVILLLLRKFIDKPVAVFFLIMVVCGVLEYVGGWFLETYHHTKWWDYTGFFLNIQGRVCLESVLAFGIMGMMGIYFIAPSLAGLFDKLSRRWRYGLCIVLGAAFAADFVYSQFNPNMAAGVPL